MVRVTLPVKPTYTLPQVREILAAIDAKEGAWANMLSKDVPAEITTFVVEAVKRGNELDQVRFALGFKSSNDNRWKKIMTAIRSSRRIDATGIFLKWMERNESWGDKLNEKLNAMIEGEAPINKTLLSALTSISQLQLATVKLGKELGVFAEPKESGGGGQGVTIVVQTNVPSPDPKVIEIHNQERMKKAQELLELNKPKE